MYFDENEILSQLNSGKSYDELMSDWTKALKAAHEKAAKEEKAAKAKRLTAILDDLEEFFVEFYPSTIEKSEIGNKDLAVDILAILDEFEPEVAKIKKSRVTKDKKKDPIGDFLKELGLA